MDLLRAVSIVIVVLGHWTMAAVTADAGIHAGNILSLADWTHPFTWLFPVMPVFFVVGGVCQRPVLAVGAAAGHRLRRPDLHRAPLQSGHGPEREPRRG